MTKLCEYLNYSLPVDIRTILTMSDVDISQALGTCLVRVGPDGQVCPGLARSWEFDHDGKFVDFHIDPLAKWSDGSGITVQDIIASFRDARAHFQKSIPTLFESFSTAEEIAPSTLRVHLTTGIDPQDFVGKLVGPALGILKLVNWSPSLEITSGPYSIRSVDEKEMILQINPHWLFHSPDMISEIHLRRSSSFVTATTLIEDQWPDMVNLITGVTKQELAKVPDGFSVLRIDEHRLLNMHYVGQNQLEGARAVFAYLRAHADFSKIADLFEGGVPARQVYPPSFALHGKTPPTPVINRDQLLKAWSKPEIRIGYWIARLQPEIKEAFENVLRQVLPIQIEFVGLGHKDLQEAHFSRSYDLKTDFLFSSVGINDRNWDSALSYYIERDPVHFRSDRTVVGNFQARLKAIRVSPGDHIEAYRNLVYDVVDQNYFLPIAHFATTFVARPEVDFSQVAKLGQVVPFSSLRRKK